MIVALAVVALVLLVVAVGATISTLQANQRLARERELVQQLRAETAAEIDARSAVQEQLAESSKRATDAGTRADAAERRATDAEQRATAAGSQAQEADQRVAAAEAHATAAVVRADAAERRAAEAEAHPAERRSDDTVPALWELERLRLEREWREVAGPAAPLPVPWDGTAGAAIAVELELIREVVGTPSRLQIDSGSGRDDPAAALWITRLTGELLRRLAHTGEELAVTISTPTDVEVTVAIEPGAVVPDIHPLDQMASAAGGAVQLTADVDVWRATVSGPATGNS